MATLAEVTVQTFIDNQLEWISRTSKRPLQEIKREYAEACAKPPGDMPSPPGLHP